MENYLKIFGVDMSGTLIDAIKKGNKLSYQTNLSYYFLELLSEILSIEEKGILIKDIKKYSITKINNKKIRLHLSSNWREIYDVVISSTKNEKTIIVEDTLHIMGSTKEYFLFADQDKYINALVQQILNPKEKIGVVITDSFIAEKLAENLSINFPSLDFYLFLDKDRNSYGNSNKNLWEKWLGLCINYFNSQALDFFQNPKVVEIQKDGKIYYRPKNSLRVLKYGPNHI